MQIEKDLSFSVCFEYDLAEKLTGFAEYFSRFEKGNKSSHNADAGLLYSITGNLQIDIAMGRSLHDQADWFVTAGISHRF